MSSSHRSLPTHKLALGAVMIMALVLLAGLGTGWANGGSGESPTISSDKADYAIGDLVVLTGENWQPGEQVQIEVEDSEGKTWTHQVVVTADEEGNVRDEFFLPDWFVAVYNVKASGASGIATTSFTDGNVFVKNATTVPAGVAVDYKIERWNNKSNCTGAVPTTATSTITGPGVSSVSGTNSVGANDKDSVRITFVSAPAGYAFEKWHAIDKAPANSVGEDGAFHSNETSFCLNVTDSNISRSYVGFLKVTATPPVPKAGDDQIVDEGSSVNLDGSGSTGATSYSWEQLTGPSVTLTGANTAKPSFTAPDGPATLTFRLTATNGAGSKTDDVQVSVKNVNPTVELSGPESANEGDKKDYSITASDPAGSADPLSFEVSCGANGTEVSDGDGDPQTFRCSFPDGPAKSTVSVVAKDGDGGEAKDSLEVDIANVKPVVKVSGPASVDEGSTQTYTYTVEDPGADTPSISEGCGVAATPVDTPAALSYDCTFGDGPGSTLVEVRANDGDAIGSGTVSVTIKNVNPTVELSGPESANEGDKKDYSITASDPAGSADPLSFEVSCGANGTEVSDGDGDPQTFRCSFPDGPAKSTVSVVAKDGDGGEAKDSLEVDIANVKPVVKVSGPASVDEGSTQTYTYTVEDPGADTPSISEGCGVAATPVDTPAALSYDCTFGDGPGSTLVEVRANDGDAIGSGTVSVTIKNVNPTVELSGPESANEGDKKDYSITASDPAGSADPLSFEVSCGANGTEVSDGDGDPQTFRCSFPDGPAKSTVSVVAKDGDGGEAKDSLEVDIANVKPVVKVSGPASVDEGSTQTYTYTVEDPGADTPSISEGCGVAATPVDTPAALSYDCTFGDGPGSTLVEVRANDGDAIGSGTVSVTIKNVNPTVELSGPESANEGDKKDYSITASDPAGSADPLSFEVSCGANGTEVSDGDGDPQTFRCSFPDGPAKSTVSVVAKDGDGGEAKDSLEVDIANVKPVVKVSGPASVDEGSTQTYTYTVEDPGADTPSISEGCGVAATPVDTPAALSYDCTFGDGPGSTLVEVRANDGDAIGSGTVSVTIKNVNPTVELSGPESANEGDKKDYSITASDPAGSADPLSFEVSCGANGTEVSDGDGDPQTFRCSFPDGPAKSTVSVVAKDGDGGEAKDSLEVDIANVKPTGKAGGPYSGNWGDPIEFNGSATDPAGPNDTLTFEWDFDYDGVTFDVDATGASPSNTYSAPGSYTAALQVSDEDGGVDEIRTATVTVGKRPTTLTYSGDSSEQYSDVTDLKATLLDGSTGIAGKTIKFTIGTQSTTATTNSEGVATATLKITQANGSYTVKSSFEGDSLYGAAYDSDPFTIKQENAGATYTGDLFAQTSSTSSSTATVVLGATIKDITALIGDPAYDASAGEIPFAKVTFVINGTDSSECANLPVGLVSLADTKVGTATCNWKANIGSKDSEAFTVGIKVGGRYTRYESGDSTVVTVSKPIGTNFITGGGYLINQKSAGQKAGGLGLKTNFGFNVKYNKAGTNLQGNINAIVRNGGQVFQVKGNAMTSLYVKAQSTKPSAIKPNTATFTGKANIQDITNPLDVKAIDGNATLQVTMTDTGEPGSYDKIGITVSNKAGGLWFSSTWDGTKTIEQLLGGGNLSVH